MPVSFWVVVPTKAYPKKHPQTSKKLVEYWFFFVFAIGFSLLSLGFVSFPTFAHDYFFTVWGNVDKIFDQIFGQIFDQIFGQGFDQGFGRGESHKYSVQCYPA